MEYKYEINGTEQEINIEGSRDSMQATLGDRTYEVTAIPAGDNCLVLSVNGQSYPIRYARDEHGIHVMLKGLNFIAVDPGGGTAVSSGDVVDLVDGKQVLVAPMPGQVVKVNVNVGDTVNKKQCLVIVEAMKMENELNSGIEGTVTAVHVEAGQQVGAMQLLVEVTQAEGE